MKKILTIFSFVLLIINFLFALDVEDDCAVILLDSTRTTITDDNKTVQDHYEKIKILNTRGREVFGDIKRRFNSEKQTFQIIKAHTITPRGEIVKPVQSGISVVSAPEVGYATQYTNMQMQVVSFPALEPGAIIEYKYKISYKESAEKPPSGKIVWKEKYPVKRKIYEIAFPESKNDEFRFVMKKTDIKPKTTINKGTIAYHWEMRDIKRIKNEADRPSNSEISSLLYYSFNNSWEDVLKGYKEKFYQAAKITEPIRERVELIVTEEENKVEQIVNYIKQNIRNVELYFYNDISAPNPAEEVLLNKYGTPQDKAVLLVALLKAVDIKSYPVLTASTDIVNIQTELPMMNTFSYILVAIPFEGSVVYVSPSDQFCQYGWLPYKFQDREAVAVQEDKIEFLHIPISDLEKSKSHTTLKATVDANGKLSGEFRIEGSGYYDQKIREALKFKNRHLQEIYFNDFVNSLRSGAELTNFSFTNPEFLQQNMFITVEFAIPNYVTVQGERKKIAVPKPTMPSANIHNYSSAGSREYGIKLGPPRSISYLFQIELPAEFKATYLPNTKLNFEKISNFHIDSNHNAGNLEFLMNYKYHNSFVPAEKYEKFKKYQKGYFNQNNWLLLFK
ncbi:MAG: DUF3857 domain-containing transglutaminase family protein [Candidatus Cloacimonetes bacterium]|nr:DUF3857 domain-containing transglutaminase family protein [Candidatus Cloacimonadota bacterium]MBS3767526.1 DUF3857 domain-containing transglutaminase family protein [Candidatus Cloacimonadota bacterium]